MSDKEKTEPAFPSTWCESDGYGGRNTFDSVLHGMNLREYAAIKLRVPDSGIDWPDAMINRARTDAERATGRMEK